jgi:hypothetical protein
MKKAIFITLVSILVLLIFCKISFSQGGVKAAKILEYNEDYNFIIIDLGEIDGLKKGEYYALIKDGEKIGKIQLVKVRENISACDIKEIAYKGAILGGDVVSIEPIGKVISPAKIPKEKKKKGKREKVVKRETIWQKFTSPFRKLFKAKEEEVISEEGMPVREVSKAFETEGTTLRMEIKADKNLTFYTLRDVLNEHHIIVVHSNRLEGTLTAFKIADFTFPEEFFADLRGLREKKIVYSAKVKGTEEQDSQIRVDMKMVYYTMKQKVMAKDIERGKDYEELKDILIEAKQRAEKFETKE